MTLWALRVAVLGDGPWLMIRSEKNIQTGTRAARFAQRHQNSSVRTELIDLMAFAFFGVAVGYPDVAVSIDG